MARAVAAATAVALVGVTLASDPGCFPSCLAPTPPRGWRSWNVLFRNLTQEIAVQVADALVARVMPVDPLAGPLESLANTLPGATGRPVSLKDLGYARVGEDDGWEDCGAGVNGSFHNSTGWPLFDSKWPNVRQFTDYAHSLGLAVDWYANNDGCPERGLVPAYYYQDAYTHINENNCDGIKFDAGGPGTNMTDWAIALNATGKAVLIENCNDNDPFRPSILPDGSLNCPYHFFRTSIDNAPSFISAISNMMDTAPWLNISQPDCWAYADMLEVGAPAPSLASYSACTPQRMSEGEARASFAMWAVTSQPLILSFDVTNATEYATWFPIVSNRIALAINSMWNGTAGALVARSPQNWTGLVYHGARCEVSRPNTLPAWTVWAKPVNASAVAIVAVNTLNSTAQNFSVPFATLGLPPSARTASVTDVWTGKPLPAASGGAIGFSLQPSGHSFVVLSMPAAEARLDQVADVDAARDGNVRSDGAPL